MTAESGTSSVVRALSILRTCAHENRALTLGELSARVGMPKSSVHRLVATLEREGFIARHADTGRYCLGLGVLRLAGPALAALDLRQIARPHLEALAQELKDTIHLGVLDRGEVVYIDKIESRSRVQMISHVGGHAPAHCTGLGKAMLAYLNEETVSAIVDEFGLPQYTPDTIDSLPALLRELATTRERGYALDEGEHESMVRCVAAPIQDSRSQIVGAVSATTVASEWEAKHRATMIREVVSVAHAISGTLGAPTQTRNP